MKLSEIQFQQAVTQMKRAKAFPGNLYSKKYADIDLDSIKTQEDFENLPFTEKDELREVYPLGIQAVPDEEIVRIHS